jgi:hypothetical protein
MRATRSSASQKEDPRPHAMQTLIEEAVKDAVTIMNIKSGGSGGAERLTAQLIDYFWTAYQRSNHSGSASGLGGKPRAYIMYNNEANTDLTCAMNLNVNGWEENPRQVGSGRRGLTSLSVQKGSYGPTPAKRATAQAKYRSRWDVHGLNSADP